MPILEVEIVGEPEAARRAGLARRLADEAGAVLGSGPQGTWARVRVLPAQDYAENGGGPGPGVRPVFVRLLLARHPETKELAELVRRLTEAVARQVDRPVENVHVIVEPPAAGRVAFGGELRT
ncbi:MAG: hypothetical protein DRQ55_13730 [Planctomycetota bacterium]|nr:MAG: hypothetical protein DRQ55_13730 [Planctomycetota bacterium]